MVKTQCLMFYHHRSHPSSKLKAHYLLIARLVVFYGHQLDHGDLFEAVNNDSLNLATADNETSQKNQPPNVPLVVCM